MGKTDSLVLEIVVDAKTGLPVIKNLREQTKGLGEDMKKGGDSAKGMFGQMALGVGAAMAASRALGIVKDMVVDSIKAYQDSERASTQLDAVLKSTGKAAGYNADQIKAMAAELQRTTAFEDDAILSAQNLLLTFDKISGETFPRATKAALDMAQATGQDLKSAMQVAGKALNEPIEGISALTRIGVRFSDSQKDMIKNFVEMGEVSKAQAIILDEIEGRFGGSAEAFAKTSAGQLEQLKNAWGDVQEDIGKEFVENLRPLLAEVTNWLAENKDEIIALGREGAQAFGDIAGAVTALLKGLFAVREVLGTIPSSIGGSARLFQNDIKEQLGKYEKLAIAQTKYYQSFLFGEGQIEISEKAIAAEKIKNHEDDIKRIKARGELYAKHIEAEAKAREAATQKELDAINSILTKYDGVPNSILDQLKAHRENAKAIGLQGDLMKRLQATIASRSYLDALEKMPEAAQKTLDTVAQYPGVMNDVEVSLNGVDQKTSDMSNTWAELNAQAEIFGKALNSVFGALDAIGIKTGGLRELLGGALGGVTSGLGMIDKAGNKNDLTGILGRAGGWLSIASAGVSVLSGLADLLGLTKTGLDETIESLGRAGVSIDENLVKQLEAARKAGKDVGAEMAKTTAAIIAQNEVTERNFFQLSKLVRDVFMQFDNGRLTVQEATKAYGDAFVELAKKAEDAGQAGGRALSNMIGDARNRGMVSGNMMAWIDSERMKGIASLEKHIAGISGTQDGYNRALRDTMAIYQGMIADGKSYTEIIDALGPALDKLLETQTKQGFTGADGYLAELLGMREFVEKNADVLDSIGATQAVLDSLAKTGILTAERFADAQANTAAYYDQLIAGGASADQAINALLPMLSKQLWYAEQYGYELDDNTKRLIEQAKEQGKNLDAAIPAEERMADGIEKLVKLFEKLTGGIDKSTDSMKRLAEQSERVKTPRGYEDDGEEPTGFATGTFGRYVPIPRGAFDVGEIGRERVSIRGGMMKVTPTTSRTGSDSRPQQVNITLTLPNVTNTNVVSELNRALELNTGGLKTNLIKMTRGH